jgi:hypothetical protein
MSKLSSKQDILAHSIQPCVSRAEKKTRLTLDVNFSHL